MVIHDIGNHDTEWGSEVIPTRNFATSNSSQGNQGGKFDNTSWGGDCYTNNPSPPWLWTVGWDAKQFNLERFSEGISKATKGQASFFPFGWGPRICIGQNFALIEIKMALPLILQNFSFETSSFAHAPYSIKTVQPQFGPHIILHKI